MPATEKTIRPTILTESDQTLNDLKSELVQLKSRMCSIETEQENNRILVEKLSFQEDLINETIANHHEEIQIGRENFHLIADIMNHLKTPVTNVVSNLSSIIADIEDSEAKKTLQDCMNTASTVLNSFDDVEDFCLTANTNSIAPQTPVNIREYFRGVLSPFQLSSSYQNMGFRLLVDKQVPENSALYCEIITECIDNLISEVQHLLESAKTTLRVSSEQKEEKYGLNFNDLSITLEWGGSSPAEWRGSWLTSIQSNHERLVNSGFNLLKTRELVRKTGGRLEVLSHKNKICGFKLLIPLTC